MVSRIHAFIRENEMIKPNDRVLVGVSGGPDSICLLFVLHMLQKEMDFALFAVHVNHGLRGREADRDQNFVEKLCEEYGIPLLCCFQEVRKKAKEEKLQKQKRNQNRQIKKN